MEIQSVTQCSTCGNTTLRPLGILKSTTKDTTIVIYRQYYCEACGNITTLKEV